MLLFAVCELTVILSFMSVFCNECIELKRVKCIVLKNFIETAMIFVETRTVIQVAKDTTWTYTMQVVWTRKVK